MAERSGIACRVLFTRVAGDQVRLTRIDYGQGGRMQGVKWYGYFPDRDDLPRTVVKLDLSEVLDGLVTMRSQAPVDLTPVEQSECEICGSTTQYHYNADCFK